MGFTSLILLLLLQTAPATGVKVSGRVLDGMTNRPSVGTLVTLWQSTPRQTKTGPNGQFEFTGVAPGRFQVRADRAPMLSLPILIQVSNRDEEVGLILGIPGANGMSSTPVQVVGNALLYMPNVGIGGRIVVDGGGVLPQGGRPLSVTLSNADSVVTNIVPDLTKEGMFRLGMLEGEYKFAVANVPSGYAVKSTTYGAVNLQREPLKVTAFPLASILITLTKS
jgi:hypothetical protein